MKPPPKITWSVLKTVAWRRPQNVTWNVPELLHQKFWEQGQFSKRKIKRFLSRNLRIPRNVHQEPHATSSNRYIMNTFSQKRYTNVFESSHDDTFFHLTETTQKKRVKGKHFTETIQKKKEAHRILKPPWKIQLAGTACGPSRPLNTSPFRPTRSPPQTPLRRLKIPTCPPQQQPRHDTPVGCDVVTIQKKIGAQRPKIHYR